MEKELIVADTRWQLVQRILASPQFARSARLKAFLQYVTQCALLEQPDQVSEQQIGIHVFGRPADYNAGDDNIVRSQARYLRAKLTEYYESTAGQEEPVVLEIPKGSYLPHFVPRVAAASVEEPPPAPVVKTAFPLGFVAVAVLVLLAGWMVWRQRTLPPVSASGHPLWSRLFDGNRPTTIVAADYIFSMVQEAAGRTLTLDEYLGADYFGRVEKLNTSSGLEKLFPNIAARHYTGFENVTCVARLLATKPEQATHTAVRFARDMTMRDITSGNLVLLGSKQSNPWDTLFEDRLNFRVEYRGNSHNLRIVNRAPRAGEQEEYLPSPLEATTRDIYGLIAFVPNVNHESDVLILQATSMAGTEVALETLDNPALFRELQRQMGSGKLAHFEALIRTRTLNGVAGESSILATRVLD